MSLSTQAAPRTGPPATETILAGLQAIARGLERGSWLALALLLCCSVPLALIETHSRQLNADELYTWHIAHAPSLPAMVSLARETDLHPPLSYLLERASLHLAGPRWLTARLPSVLAAFTASLLLFCWIRQRLGGLHACSAVALLWLSSTIDFAWQNRPYMLWFATLLAVVLGWSSTLHRPLRPWMVPALAALVALCMETHIFAVACLLPLLGGELLHWHRTGRRRWPILLAICLPSLLLLPSLYQVRHFAAGPIPPPYQASFQALGTAYLFAFGTLLLVAACACAAVALLFPRDLVPPRESPSHLRLLPEEVLLCLLFLALPALLTLASAARGTQFFDRYGLPCTVAVFALLPHLMRRFFPRPRLFAVLLVLAALGNTLARCLTDRDVGGTERPSLDAPGLPLLRLQDLDRSLPIVAASALTFTEIDDRESPAVADRSFYLTDRIASVRYAHSVLFSNEDKISNLLGLRGHVLTTQAFQQQYPCFYLLGNIGPASSPEDWLLSYLADGRATLRYLGRPAASYKDNAIFVATWQSRSSAGDSAAQQRCLAATSPGTSQETSSRSSPTPSPTPSPGPSL